MSYHRVLPPLPSSTAPNSATPCILAQHSLQQQPTIMLNHPSNAIVDRTRSLKLSQKNLSPVPEPGPVSPDVDSLEDYVESPRDRTRSSSQASSGEIPHEDKHLPVVPKPGAVSWQGESPSQICLCQPDPKVPRPRNAFILYRQHHQANVVAQNPGLANPEISKVIGDHWRSSPEEVKQHWKILAEEEKLRHQKQYPDYRYQPRRTVRHNSLSKPAAHNPLAEAEDRRCPKCGGRSITTPTSVMITPSHSAASPPGTYFSPNKPPSTPSTGSSAHRFLHNLGSPYLSSATPGFHVRSTTSSNASSLPLGSPRFKRPDSADFPLSPDPKRRRANGTYNPIRAPNGQAIPFPFHQRRQESLPRPDFMPSQSSTFTMAPPPRPHPHHLDSSLTLPPLQTSPTTLDSPASAQAKSLEAMVMSIPILNKIRVLAKISPPLAPPGPTSPAHRTRGFVIAIDGFDLASVLQITDALSSALTVHHPVRVFRGPAPFPALKTAPRTAGGDDFPSYLGIISQYHTLSSEIASYITTPPSLPSSSPPASPLSPKTLPATKPTTRSVAASQQQQQQQQRPTTPPTAVVVKTTATPPGVPIALVPSFQLSHTDASASRVPIADAYAPVDHWQWMATLWRGVVGPDVTIAVLPASPMGVPSSSGVRKAPITGSGSGSLGGKGAGGSSSSSKGGGGGVEVRLEDARAIVVKGDGGGVGEGMLRRVGFEVSEWVRGKEEGGRRGS